jgi:hypothetical protein
MQEVGAIQFSSTHEKPASRFRTCEVLLLTQPKLSPSRNLSQQYSPLKACPNSTKAFVMLEDEVLFDARSGSCLTCTDKSRSYTGYYK